MAGLKPTKDEVRRLDPVLSTQWAIQITQAPTGVPNFVSTKDLNTRCTIAKNPKRTGEPVMVEIRGHRVPKPGHMQSDNTLNLTLLSTTDAIITTFIDSWANAITDPITGARRAPQEGLFAKIRLVQLNNQDKEICEWRMVDVFLQDWDIPDNSESTPEAQKISLVLSYADFTYKKL